MEGKVIGKKHEVEKPNRQYHISFAYLSW